METTERAKSKQLPRDRDRQKKRRYHAKAEMETVGNEETQGQSFQK